MTLISLLQIYLPFLNFLLVSCSSFFFFRPLVVVVVVREAQLCANPSIKRE